MSAVPQTENLGISMGQNLSKTTRITVMLEQYQNNVRVTHWGRPHIKSTAKGGGGDLANTEDTDEVGEGGLVKCWKLLKSHIKKCFFP